MVAIPLGYDQFGVATRIVYHGVGESLEVNNLWVDGLHTLMQRVLNTPSYRERAQYFKDIIARRRGLDVAAEVIEQAFQTSLANGPLEISRS
jgi:zeaxanthin glucosyltransferase